MFDVGSLFPTLTIPYSLLSLFSIPFSPYSLFPSLTIPYSLTHYSLFPSLPIPFSPYSLLSLFPSPSLTIPYSLLSLFPIPFPHYSLFPHSLFPIPSLTHYSLHSVYDTVNYVGNGQTDAEQFVNITSFVSVNAPALHCGPRE